MDRANKLTPEKTRQEPLIKRYHAVATVANAFHTCCSGRGFFKFNFENTSEDHPIAAYLLQPCLVRPFVGLQPCRERMGVEPMLEEGLLDLCCEFFDDPSRYLLAKMVVSNQFVSWMSSPYFDLPTFRG